MLQSLSLIALYSLATLTSAVQGQPLQQDPIYSQVKPHTGTDLPQGLQHGRAFVQAAVSGATKTSITSTTSATKTTAAAKTSTTSSSKTSTEPTTRKTSSTTSSKTQSPTTSSSSKTSATTRSTTTTTKATSSSKTTSSSSSQSTATTVQTGENALVTSYGMDQFPKRLLADFSSAKAGGDVSAALLKGGLYISTADVPADDSPYSRHYARDNVVLGNGQLEMSVSKYSGSGPVMGSSILTSQKFKYGSARVVMKSTAVEGICIGHFFYESDYQETDIEILTSSATKASSTHEEGIWFSNQATSKATNASKQLFDLGFDPSEGFHEYRIDWLPTYTAYLIDGKERGRLTTNVPSEEAQYVLNGWSDGGTWSLGPPETDATFAIKAVEVLYGYTG